MKTKTIFMLAAMLLMSMGAFAQSNEPLEGDVNNDGKVDVADIVKVIDIMQNSAPQPAVTYYWYVGTTKPTSLDQCEVISEYPAEQIFENPSTSKCYVYVLTNLDKTVNFYDPAFPTIAGTKIEDTTSIPGYKISTISGDGVNPSKLSVNGSIIIRIS